MRAWALLAVLLLAGCSGGGGEDTSQPTSDCTLEPVLCDPGHYLANHPCIKGDIRPRIYAPDTPGPDSQPDPWKQGDWWEYSLDVGAGPRRTTLVYYDDADVIGGRAQHYLVGVASRAEALEHALYSVNPMLGRIHRSLYSPHESGMHADMFSFPLCEGSTWTTGFYSTTFAMTARQEPVALPGGSTDPDGFRITGTAADGSTLEHTYSPKVKWFTELALRRADGLRVTMDLEGFGSGKSGRIEFLRAQMDEVLDLKAVTRDGTVVHREKGGEGPYDRVGIAFDLSRSAGTGKVEAHLRAPDGSSKACVGIAGSGPLETTTCPAPPLRTEVPWAEGDWKVTVETLLVDTQTRWEGQARIVSMYDRGGTV